MQSHSKKYVFLVPLCALFLSGCTTPAIKSEDPVKENLQFTELKKESAQSKTNEKQKATPEKAPTTQPVTSKKMYSYPPVMSLDTTKEYQAVLKTSAGEMTVVLNAKSTPVTVNSFVFLAKEKFYDRTIFHRTIPGFMIQGGDPQGTGMGGPGYKFADEKFNESYERGTLAMANSGPDTNGSQFFIMHKDYALPPNYTIFGKVTSGLEVIDTIVTAPTKPGGEGSSPITPVTIESVTIIEK